MYNLNPKNHNFFDDFPVIFQKCVKKQKFCLKMRENRDSRKIIRRTV